MFHLYWNFYVEGPVSTVGHCGVGNCEHKDASLSHRALQLEANQQTPFLPPEHTFDLRESDEDVTFEVEVENSERQEGKLSKNSRNSF